MDLIAEGCAKKLISFDTDKKEITYINHRKPRKWSNPEEKVQAETFVKLVILYGYKPERIKHYVTVTMGASSKEADLIVYNDDNHQSPHIVVECKHQDVSELEFKQAVEQGFSYAVADGAKYVWTTSGIKNEYYQVPSEKPKARISIPDIPQYGVDKLARYKYAKDGGKVNGQRLFAIETVTEDDLTRRFKQAHDSLWGGGELNPSAAFDELDKLIFCKIWDERKVRKAGEPYDFQIITEESTEKTNKSLLERIKKLYEEGRKRDPEVFKDDIRLSADKLRTVVGYLESINLSETDLDSKGRAFETFMGSFFRGDFGQYFTPRNIVKFIVDTLPIKHDSLVLDTSCGSGGFLLHALDKVRTQAGEYYPDQIGGGGTPEGKDHYKHWHDFAEKNLYGIEINEQIARTAKMNMIIHDDGHTNVIASDGLISDEEMRAKTKNQGFKYDRFNFIITNPPFGSTIRQSEQAYMKNYGFAMRSVDWLNPKSKEGKRDNQSTEVLFIEQCYNFLADHGYLAIVLPDSILTNSSMQYVRDGIEEKFRIVAVVSMPQTAFSATGAGVKSSVMFFKKHPLKMTKKIQKLKRRLQENALNKNSFMARLKEIDVEKKQHIKELRDFENAGNLSGKDLIASESYKNWKKYVNGIYASKVDTLKEKTADDYQVSNHEKMDDYPIFMAIAEDIGYDATGKETGTNELNFISTELSRFIEGIETRVA